MTGAIQYNGSKWRGGVLKVQPAKQRYQEKLALERTEEAEQQAASTLMEEQSRDPFQLDVFVDQPLQLFSPDGKVGHSSWQCV